MQCVGIAQLHEFVQEARQSVGGQCGGTNIYTYIYTASFSEIKAVEYMYASSIANNTST